MSQDVESRSQVKANLVANFAGHLWTAIIGLFCVPLYVKFMGVESYGLFSLCSAMAGLLLVLDLGLSTAAIRETAMLSAIKEREGEIRSLLRTLECIYWIVSALIASAVFALSPWVAFHWISPDTLSRNDVYQTVFLLGISVACRWPSRLYGGVLQGRQEQVLLNWILGAAATVRSIGAVIVLWAVSPTIQAFLLCQIAGDLVETVASKISLRKVLPRTAVPPKFEIGYLVQTWRFTAGVGSTEILYAVLSQMDRLILSRLVTLKTLGYYSIASVAAAALLKLLVPIGTAGFPRFAELISRDDIERLKRTYHAMSQLVSVLSIPACTVITLFSYELLLLWTGDSATASAAHTVLTILAIAMGIQVITGIPVSLQLASGWTSLVFSQTAVSLLLGAPLMILFTLRYGLEGTALVWLILHAGALFITIPVMHTRILSGEKWKWYGRDVALPALAAAIPVLLARLVLPPLPSRPIILLALLVISAASFVAAVLAATMMRREAFRYLDRIVRVVRGEAPS